jgi:hypothetical protein
LEKKITKKIDFDSLNYKNIESNTMKSDSIYIVDFLNIFSDFREIKYKKNKIDFHNVKNENILNDTLDFFNVFFTKYIQFAHINLTNSNFIFIVKKIPHFESVIKNVLFKYSKYNFRFVVIENKFNIDILDKNKDDFLCQYIFHYFLQINQNCTLISNDKYRDLSMYKNKFPTFINIKVFKHNSIDIQIIFINPDITKKISDILNRKSIPKSKLHYIV